MDLRSQTLALLKKHNIRPRDKLGQNFLVDRSVIQRQVEYAGVGDGDTVLEVGPGTGILTEALAKKAGKVIAVEKDTLLAKVLEDVFGATGNVEIVRGDILNMDLPSFDKCVSNIPYVISSPLTFRLVDTGFDVAVILYQKEFAERMRGRTGERNYSRLSVACYYSLEVELMETVKPSSFYPEPKVSSAVVRLTPKEKPFEVDKEAYFKLVKALFIHRGKTVRNALFHSFDIAFGEGRTKEEKRGFLRRLDPDLLDKKVFKTTPEEMAMILHDIENTGI